VKFSLNRLGQAFRRHPEMPRVERVGQIITSAMIPEGMDSDNINGPSLVKVPSWVDSPLGAYYLYFAHHIGAEIRMAYADHPEGPYTVHNAGALELADVPACQGHIASPDVHIDEANERFLMYFHGPRAANAGIQSSYIAESGDGVTFAPISTEILGLFYFRVWFYDGYWYALGKARLYRSADGITGFTEGPIVYEVPGTNTTTLNGLGNIRHTAVDVRGDKAFVYFTRQGDAPERILRGEIDMTQTWTEWAIANIQYVMEPEEEWEGASNPLARSIHGAATGARQLRDPCVYREGDQAWLLYCGAGEEAIGIARIIA
jgi:hypothetical protein